MSVLSVLELLLLRVAVLFVVPLVLLRVERVTPLCSIRCWTSEPLYVR
jgi:hypothetical protein